MARSDRPPAPDPGGGNGAEQGAGFGARVGSLGRAAQSLSDELHGTAADLGRALDLRGRVQRHPYAMVAAALGVGYVLGGGLFSRTTVRLLGIVGRVSSLPFMRSEMVALAEALLAGQDREPPASPPTSGVPSPS